MAPADPPALVVCDAGPLIHLEELRSLDLLTAYDEILVPEAVWREVKSHRPSALQRRRVPLNLKDVIPEPSPELIALILEYALDAGEQEALRLLAQFPEARLLTDDAAARAAAVRLGFDVQGTIGTIVRAWPQGQRTKRQVLNLLKSIPRRSSLFVAPALLNSAIAKVEQSASPP